MPIFGCIQIVMSQIPDFHDMEWLSVLATITSFSYSSIGLALDFAKVVGNYDSLPPIYLLVLSDSLLANQALSLVEHTGNRAIKGSIGGVPVSSGLKKMTLLFQALGGIAFAYPYTNIVLEIQVFSFISLNNDCLVKRQITEDTKRMLVLKI